MVVALDCGPGAFPMRAVQGGRRQSREDGGEHDGCHPRDGPRPLWASKGLVCRCGLVGACLVCRRPLVGGLVPVLLQRVAGFPGGQRVGVVASGRIGGFRECVDPSVLPQLFGCRRW